MYRSPIRLAGLPETGAGFDKQTLSLARKKMLAELELGDGHAIIVDGTELNRQDIARLFDELGNEQQLAYHTAIYHDPALLTFLETGTLSAYAPGWAQNEVYDTPGFRSFVSPHFAAAMSLMFQKILSGSEGSGTLTKFLRQRSFLSPADHDTAYTKVTRYFLEIKNRILLCLHRIENPDGAATDAYDTAHAAPQTAQVKVTKEEIETLCNDYDIFVLNQLPEEFDDLRYSLVDGLNDICVTCDHAGRPALAYAAISKASSINCESLRELVQKNKAVVYDKMQPRSYRTTSPPQKEQPLRWIGLILFIFITIVRLANSSGCNNHSSSYGTIEKGMYYNSDGSTVNASDEEESVTDMKTYYNLVGAFNRMSTNAGVSLAKTNVSDTDKVVQLLHKEKNGIDVLAPVWEELGLKPVDSMPRAESPDSKLFICNKSKWPAIITYALDQAYFGSVYILPHSKYTLHYNCKIINADFYSGDKWSVSETIDVPRHIGHGFSTIVRLKGGFGAYSRYRQFSENVLLYHSGNGDTAYKDRITIEDDAEYGTRYTTDYNEEKSGAL